MSSVRTFRLDVYQQHVVCMALRRSLSVAEEEAAYWFQAQHDGGRPGREGEYAGYMRNALFEMRTCHQVRARIDAPMLSRRRK